MDEQKLNRFAVVGNPVAHSRSPMIHESFATQFGLQLSYEKIKAETDTFNETVETFFASGGKGLNITTPFKRAAADLADSCSDMALASNSVNTLYIDNKTGKLVGESTDGVGWLKDIQRLGIVLKNSRVLMIGAGGAAGVIVNQLLKEQLQQLHVCNRTLAKAEHLVNDISFTSTSTLKDIPNVKWDLVINTLSVGWHSDYPDIKVNIDNKSKAYDLNYGEGANAFKKWFVQRGGEPSAFYEGWGMLVEQAAKSFYIWWDKKPDTSELISLHHSSNS